MTVAEPSIPLIDLKGEFTELRGEILAAIGQVLDGMHLYLGENVRAFESEFAGYCGTADAVGVGSGTDALSLALRAVGVGPGDEVLTVPNTFIATIEAILMIGARPIFVDVDADAGLMVPAALERALTPKVRAILPVHLYGQTAPMGPILEWASARGVPVVEDACQAHGAMDESRRAGSMGTCGCFSFYFSKNLGAYGEAGAVTTNDPRIAATIRKLRDHGSDRKYVHSLVGTNSRLDEMQAAILRVKLRRLDQGNEARRRHAAGYNRLLAGSDLKLPVERPGARHVYHLYVVQSDRRDVLHHALAEAGIGAGKHYPVPVHLQEALMHLGLRAGDFPVSERFASRVLSLPMYPGLTSEQIRRVCEVILRAIREA